MEIEAQRTRGERSGPNEGLGLPGLDIDMGLGAMGWVLSFCVAKHEVARGVGRGILRGHGIDYDDFEFLDAVRECPPSREQMALLGRRLELSDSSLRRRVLRVRDLGWLVSDDGGGLSLDRKIEKSWQRLMSSMKDWACARLHDIPTTDLVGHLATTRVLAGRLGMVRDPGSIEGFLEAAREAARRWSPSDGTGGEHCALANVMELLRLERPLFACIRRAVQQAGMDIERADLLLVLARLGADDGEVPTPLGSDGWVSLQRLRRTLVHSPWIAQAQFSRWLSELRKQGLVETVRISELGSATLGRCKSARITQLGKERIRPVWESLVHLMRRLSNDIPENWRASTRRVHVALAPDRLSPGSGSSLVTTLASDQTPAVQIRGPEPTGSPGDRSDNPVFPATPVSKGSGVRKGRVGGGSPFLAVRERQEEPFPPRVEGNPAETFLSGLKAIGGWATHEELRAHLGWSNQKYTELLALLHHRSRVDGSPDSPTVRLSGMHLETPWNALLRKQGLEGAGTGDGHGG